MAKNKQPRANDANSEQKGQQKAGTGYGSTNKKGTQSGQDSRQDAQDTRLNQRSEDCK